MKKKGKHQRLISQGRTGHRPAYRDVVGTYSSRYSTDRQTPFADARPCAPGHNQGCGASGGSGDGRQVDDTGIWHWSGLL